MRLQKAALCRCAGLGCSQVASREPVDLLILHPAITAYRAALFERLAHRLSSFGVRMVVATGGYSHSLRSDTSASAVGREVPTSRIGPFLVRRWQSVNPSPDLVIVEQAITGLEAYPLLARQLVGGPSVAMWGHGRSYSTPQGPAAAALKQFLTRRGQWFFAYTPAGAEHVVSHGFPPARVSVLNNTIDTDALVADLARVTADDTAAFQRRLGLTPGRTALFLGGLDHHKGIDFLLESAHRGARMLPGFVLLVGGAGPDLQAVQAAQAAGAPIRALGRVDGEAKALALRAADVMAIPEWIGLVAVDSLFSGRPIVSTWHPSHSPEREYLTHGVTALFTEHDSERYAEGLVTLLRSPHLLASMRSACLREAPALSLDRMTDAFVEGVLAWDDVRRAGL